MKIDKQEIEIDIWSECLIEVNNMSEYWYDRWSQCPECKKDNLTGDLKVLEATETVVTITTLELNNNQ